MICVFRKFDSSVSVSAVKAERKRFRIFLHSTTVEGHRKYYKIGRITWSDFHNLSDTTTLTFFPLHVFSLDCQLYKPY